ncbi:hypothetical protein V6N11_055953 [Hibiscus sabdariffa]|uniref:Uncharacterized protein n=1 Tax=Hibiscus sabdariffa TaxID=183260 RepID=A0ABR2T2G0_9ROSI
MCGSGPSGWSCPTVVSKPTQVWKKKETVIPPHSVDFEAGRPSVVQGVPEVVLPCDGSDAFNLEGSSGLGNGDVATVFPSVDKVALLDVPIGLVSTADEQSVDVGVPCSVVGLDGGGDCLKVGDIDNDCLRSEA